MGGFLFLFLSFNLRWETGRQRLPTQMSFTWLFKTQNNLGLWRSNLQPISS